MIIPRTRDRAQINSRLRRVSAERTAKGLCTKCSGDVKATPGRTLCPKHLEQLRRRALRRTEHRKASRLCTTCGAPAEEGLNSCAKCLKRACKDMRERCTKVKREIVAYLGGKCQMCGLVTDCMPVYEIHHLSKKSKEFDIRRLHSTTWERIKAELDKGVELLCANCHRIAQFNHWESWANR